MGAGASGKHSVDDLPEKISKDGVQEFFGDEYDETKFNEYKDEEGFVKKTDVEGVLFPLKKLFNEMDLDNNGYLNSKELGEFIKRASGSEPSAVELEYMIAEVDRNADGKVSFEEMRVIMESRAVMDAENLPSLPKLDGTYEDTTFLVIPSTGNVGHLVTKALCEVENFTVKCGFRKTSDPGLVALVKALRCEMVETDNFDVESLKNAMDGVDRVLSYFPSGNLTQWENCVKNVMEAAKEKGVKCVYWISAQHECHNKDMLIYTLVNNAVVAAKASGQTMVEIKPNNLASNLYGNRDAILSQNTMYIGYKADIPTVITDPEDVAALTLKVMTDPIEEHAGNSYVVTGPKPLSANQIGSLLSKAIHKEEVRGRRRVANQDSLEIVFKAADTNQDGTLSIQELVAALAKQGYGEEKAKEIFTVADESNDKKLDMKEFVAAVSQFYDRKEKDPPLEIKIVTLDEQGFRGFCAGFGMPKEDVDALVSLYESFNSGQCGGEDVVKTEDFQKIMGRSTKSCEEWIANNVGGFMKSHWDIVKTHARADLLLKSAFQ